MVVAPSFAGVILAAGSSTRMGQDKALIPWQGGSFLSAAIRVLQSTTDFVIVVAGENEENLAPIVHAQAAFLVRNPFPQRGQFSSLQRGLDEVLNRGRDAAIVTLVDRPAPDPQTVKLLKEGFLESDKQIWAVVPELEGKHGHPIVMGREMIEVFLRAPVDSNAREVEHAHQEHIRYLPVNDPYVVMNVNTPEDLEKLCPGSLP
jgi:molybdenum cofactor cytidylyltransferase